MVSWGGFGTLSVQITSWIRLSWTRRSYVVRVLARGRWVQGENARRRRWRWRRRRRQGSLILLKKGSVAKFGRIDDDHQHQINTERTVASHASALFFFFYYYFLVSIVGCVWGGKKRGPHCPPPLLEVGSKMDREVHGQVPLSLVLLWKVGTSILPWESSRVSSLRQADRTPPLLAFRSRPAWRRCLARSILVVGS